MNFRAAILAHVQDSQRFRDALLAMSPDVGAHDFADVRREVVEMIDGWHSILLELAPLVERIERAKNDERLWEAYGPEVPLDG